MAKVLETGFSRVEQLTVDTDRVIDFLGPRGQVYSSPSMIMDMEWCCWRLLDTYLDDGDSSVGIHVEWHHLTGTPLGQQVTVRAVVSSIDGRRVDFATEIHDRHGLAGRGSHSRVIVQVSRHLSRIEQRFAP